MLRRLLTHYYYRFKPRRLVFFSQGVSSVLTQMELQPVDAQTLENNSLEVAQAAVLAQVSNAVFTARIKAGHQLFLSRSTDRITGYYWFSKGTSSVPWENDLKLKLQSQHGYIWDCHVAKAFRNQGIYGRALTEIAARVKTGEVQTIYIYCNADNLPSRAAIEKNGFTLAGLCTLVPLPFKCAVILVNRRFMFVKDTVDLTRCISS
jgi:ribosomal protein S18 acetylase RimI-like enzyme